MRIKVLSGGRKIIELPLSDAELNFQMRRIGIEETVPMCRLVEVSEEDNPLHHFEGQTVNMDEINFFAKRMDSLTEYERKVLSAYASDYGVATMQDLINLTFSMRGLSLLTDFSDARQVGVCLCMDEFLAMSEEEKEQTNFIEFAEKTLRENRVEVLPYGVFVEHGFEMQEVYNGKTFPAYIASEETVAVVEVKNKAGDTEYLYLPTDICSMNKVKERLQVLDYWEMEVTRIENLRLPDILVPIPEDLKEIEQMTLFNEMCHAVKRFDEVKMNQLAMVVEFTGLNDFTDVAYTATHLGEFEINPFVHNDEEYGKFLVTESGLFDVDELLLPHINYASFATDKKEGKNDPSQSLQMIQRPLMTPDELKSLPKGNFIVSKTGSHPMRTKLKLFLKWGITFEEPYEIEEKSARKVAYADKQEIEEEIIRRYMCCVDEESESTEQGTAFRSGGLLQSQMNETVAKVRQALRTED